MKKTFDEHLEVHFRPGHVMCAGKCLCCGISAQDLARWPTLQCMPECCPSAERVVAAGLEVIYDDSIKA